MAKYNNRKVTIVTATQGDTQVTITQDELDGEKAIVPLSKLELTSDEQKMLLDGIIRDHKEKVRSEEKTEDKPVKAKTK